MGGMVVHLDRPPHSALLVGWGRADDGWWGCVTWRQLVTCDGADEQVPFAAWVRAASVSAPPWANPVEVPRIGLPAERRLWPAPPGWPSWYAGVWQSGPVPAPPGFELVTGALWRRRRSGPATS